MYKLQKPKAFEASESVTTSNGLEIANLKRSGIVLHSKFLIGHAGKWHEIDNPLDTAFLPELTHHIEKNNLQFSDFGLEDEPEDYDLTHTDFMALSAQFPDFDYIQIGKLHKYEKENNLNWSLFEKRLTLGMLARDKKTINQHIEELEIARNTRENEIVVDTVEAAVPLEKGLSINIIETLVPEKLNEIVLLKSEQLKIVEENPVVVITDKKTYADAKKTAAILLSASTKVDGKNGILENGKKLLNNFKNAFTSTLEEVSKITRDPYDKQKKLMSDWENKELLRIKQRTDLLFSVPFVFDGTNHTVGTLVVTEKQIKDSDDESFNKLIEQGKTIVIALEAAKTMQNAEIELLKKQNAELLAKLEALLPKQTEPEPGSVDYAKDICINNTDKDIQTKQLEYKNAGEIEVNEFKQISDSSKKFISIVEEKLKAPASNPDNTILNELDLANFSVISEAHYLNYREGVVYGLTKCAKELQVIFDNPDTTVVKSVEIKKLIKIWE